MLEIILCAGDYWTIVRKAIYAVGEWGFIFLDLILASIHVQWVSLRNMYKWFVKLEENVQYSYNPYKMEFTCKK